VSTEDQVVLVLVAASTLFVVAHLLKEPPHAPLLSAAIICLCLASALRRLVFS
jgi:uncharacterized membrane protein YccC